MKPSFARNGQERWSISFLTALRINSLYLMGAAILSIMMATSVTAQSNLSIEEAIRLSGEHSYDIKSASADSLSAMYDLGASKAFRYPTASLSATSFYINKLQSINTPLMYLSLGVHNNYQADFKLSLPLWTGGKIGGQIKIQSANFTARGANLEAVRLGNAYDTRKAYLNLMAAQAVAKASDATVSRVQLINGDTKNLYDAGMADSVNLLESELALEKALQTQDERSTTVKNAGEYLSRLISLPSDSITVLDSVPLPDISMYRNHPPQKDSLDRAELRIMDQKIRAAQYSVGLNQANYFPSLSAFGGYSYGKPNKDQFQGKWNDYWTAGFNFNWDFNLGNKTGKNVSSAGEAVNSARAAKENLADALYLQARTAYDNLLLSYRSFEVAGRQYIIAKRQYALGQEKEKAGTLSLNRLLELEADFSSADELYRASQINFYISETEYWYAIGSPRLYGGFER